LKEDNETMEDNLMRIRSDNRILTNKLTYLDSKQSLNIPEVKDIY